MLKGLGVKNLRSFQKYTYSELKPITVYLGRNSSGKSSLIRLFPLLRQSVQETTTGPILWYGKFVDFGNFNEAVCKNSDDSETITLEFKIVTSHRDALSSYYYHYYDSPIENKEISIEINISEENQKTFTKSISFEIDKSKIIIEPSTEKKNTLVTAISNNFKHVTEALPSPQIDFKFFPALNWIIEPQKKLANRILSLIGVSNSIEFYENTSTSNQLANSHYHNKKVSESAANSIKDFFHPNTNLHTIEGGIRGISYVTRDEIKLAVLNVFKSQRYFQNKMKNPHEMDEFMDILFPYILLKNYQKIANVINDSLKKSFLSVRYLAPIRANSERFYRFQDLQVDEMDHTGSNVAMILNAFDDDEKYKFQQWTDEHFGFIAFVTTDGAHYAIKIKTENDTEEHNINDMGYGFSQVLPIIMSIWLEIQAPSKNNEEIIFVIEQPELHLHPAYQTKVAALFAHVIKLAREIGKNIKFIFETHSQAMVNSLGECIEKDIISKNDVNIMIFEKDRESGSVAYTVEFDDSGNFMNWPIGFFSGE